VYAAGGLTVAVQRDTQIVEWIVDRLTSGLVRPGVTDLFGKTRLATRACSGRAATIAARTTTSASRMLGEADGTNLGRCNLSKRSARMSTKPPAPTTAARAEIFPLRVAVIGAGKGA
jgi:hypothetical protein